MERSWSCDDISLDPETMECAEEYDVCSEPSRGFLINVGENNSIWSEIKNHQKKKRNQVLLEGFDEDLLRTKSLTDDDLEELKGCFDLGFGFSYEEIPELCNTLPALELCYSMTQRFLDEQQRSPDSSETSSPSSSSGPIANWKISSPGDDPEDVKVRLKYWAQAVACTVRLCN